MEAQRQLAARSQSRKAAPVPTAPLRETEWKFDAVPPDEIEGCYFYEYSCEYFKHSRTLQDLRTRWVASEAWSAAHWRDKPRPPITIQRVDGLLAYTVAERILNSRLGYPLAFIFQSFPSVPWQELRSETAETLPVAWGKLATADRRRERRRNTRLHIETQAQLEPANIGTLPAWIRHHEFYRRGQDLSNTEYGFFAINWDYPPSEIRRAFGDWLEERRTEGKRKPRIRHKSRGEARDKLRLLGALRVKEHYRKRELAPPCDSRDSNLKVDAPYSHYPDLVVAANKARRLIAEMFPSEREAAQLAAAPFEQRRVHATLPLGLGLKS